MTVNYLLKAQAKKGWLERFGFCVVRLLSYDVRRCGDGVAAPQRKALSCRRSSRERPRTSGSRAQSIRAREKRPGGCEKRPGGRERWSGDRERCHGRRARCLRSRARCHGRRARCLRSRATCHGARERCLGGRRREGVRGSRTAAGEESCRGGSRTAALGGGSGRTKDEAPRTKDWHYNTLKTGLGVCAAAHSTHRKRAAACPQWPGVDSSEG